MGMYKCIKCGYSMCDPDFYCRAEGETRAPGSSTKAPSGKMRIQCPTCNKIQTIKEMFEKELINTPDEHLSEKGRKAKKRLQEKNE